jgi:hypothetical protein
VAREIFGDVLSQARPVEQHRFRVRDLLLLLLLLLLRIVAHDAIHQKDAQILHRGGRL